MDQTGTDECTPRLRAIDRSMRPRPWIDGFSAGYMQRTMDRLPRQGDHEPWINPQNYQADRKMFRKDPIDDGVMRFTRSSARAAVAQRPPLVGHVARILGIFAAGIRPQRCPICRLGQAGLGSVGLGGAEGGQVGHGGGPQGVLGIDAESPGPVHHAPQQLAHLVELVAVRPVAGVAPRPAGPSVSKPIDSAFFWTLVAYSRAGRAPGTPSNTLARPFSAFLICSQLATTSSAVVGRHVAEHVGMAGHQLVVHPPGHVGQGEGALLGGQPRVEGDLEQQVAELLLQVGQSVGIGGGVVLVELVEGFEHLVALLEQVAAQRVVGLLAVPRALDPQGGHQLDQARHLARHRARPARAGTARSGGPARPPGRARRPTPRRCARRRCPAPGAPPPGASAASGGLDPLVQGQLDVRQHERPSRTGPPAADPRWPAASTPKRWPSTTRTPEGDRVDAQPGPGQVEERQRRHDLDLEIRRRWSARATSSSTVRSATTGEPGTA